MDPGVRLAHDEKASRIVYREDIVAAPVTTWSDVRAVPIEASSTAQQPTFQYASSHPCQPAHLPLVILAQLMLSHQLHMLVSLQALTTAWGLQVL